MVFDYYDFEAVGKNPSLDDFFKLGALGAGKHRDEKGSDRDKQSSEPHQTTISLRYSVQLDLDD